MATFLPYMETFRAIAICFVVGGHVMSASGVVGEELVESVAANLLAGGTILFVFVSGFLFQYLSYRDFNYREFIVRKVKYLLVPYIVLGVGPVMYYVAKSDPHFDGFFCLGMRIFGPGLLFPQLSITQLAGLCGPTGSFPTLF